MWYQRDYIQLWQFILLLRIYIVLCPQFVLYVISKLTTWGNTFGEFKTWLWSFEEREKINTTESSNAVMKTRTGRWPVKMNTRNRNQDNKDMVCFKCGMKGHQAKESRQKTWCTRCKSETHKDATCRRNDKENKNKQDGACKAIEDCAGDYAFKRRDGETGTRQQTTNSIQERGLMVDTGATSHIITDMSKFKDFDNTFRPEGPHRGVGRRHQMQRDRSEQGKYRVFLGWQQRAVAQGDADRRFINSIVPPEHLFVEGGDCSGATVKEGKVALTTRDGNLFNIHVYGKLYYLHTEDDSSDKCNACHDIQTWHDILGNCNYEDVLRFQNVVHGMQITGKACKPEQECEVCI